MIKISAWMLAVPIVLGGTITHFFLQWNPYSNLSEGKPQNKKEEIDAKEAEFRNDWVKNKSVYLNQISVESKLCMQEMENNTYELPEPIQNILDIVEEKNIE